MQSKNYIKDIIVIGFALFAMFFGSGNVLFPPYLGVTTGSGWFIGVMSYMVADIFIAMLAIVVMVKSDGNLTAVTRRTGKISSLLINLAVIICIGPLFCIPRSSAATFDMILVPLFNVKNGNATSVIFSIVFFLIVYFLTVKPNKVCDIIGKFLTPLLLISLALVIVKGLITPLGPVVDVAGPAEVIKNGVIAGYQSMDVFGALNLGLVVIAAASTKGYKDKKDAINVVSFASVVCLICLFVVSLGLAYLGGTVSTFFDADVSQATLVFLITQRLYGNVGGILIGFLTGLACLTTAVGLTSGTSSYFQTLSGNKVSYGRGVLYCCIVSCIIANFGLSNIIKLAVPILTLIFPVVVVLIILSLFTSKIKKDSVFIGAAAGTFLANVLTMLSNTYNIHIPVVQYMPLFDLGFGWVLPSLIACIIGMVWPVRSTQ
ncbi:Branched-chain amino acid transport system 2 carrier protein [Clostridium sp. C105KSO15]|nr:Branched-chain amino acid transport system 2 carrier protein [Clostridium sp. C105KSO15]